MKAHSRRSVSSPVVFSVTVHEKVTALTGLVATTSAGIVRFPRGAEIGDLKLKDGDEAYLLTYQGEGHYRIWFKGHSYAEAPSICSENNRASDCIGSLVKQAEHTWWARIRNAKGQIGWVAMADGDRSVGFSFDAIPYR
jgi:hypothetical protein